MEGDEKRPAVSIVVVNYNTRDLLLDCLSSVERTVTSLDYEVIVVDNASTDGSVAMLRREFPGVTVIENDTNRGFGAANNQALAITKGRYALLLNSDTVLTEGAVDELYRFMESEPRAGMCGGQLLNRDGTKQNSIAAFPNLLTLLTNTPLLEYLFPWWYPSKRHPHREPLAVDSVIGACLMVRKEAIDDVGRFDERYFFFFEETDWAYRMKRAGWGVFHVPQAHIYHLQGQSIGPDINSRIAFYRARYQYFQKWSAPFHYRAVRTVIFLRLCVDCLLTAAGVMATLGLSASLKKRLGVYGKLILWHFGLFAGRNS